MTRKVFLIAAPFEDKHSVFFRGVMADANNYNRFFRSAIGGAYQSAEISYLANPTKNQLLKLLLQNDADYTVFVFTGHGYFSVNKNAPVLNINPNETVSIPAIRQNLQADMKLLIADTCQVYREDYESFEGIGDPAEYMNFNSTMPLQQARLIYNRDVMNCPAGFQTLYSCSPGEESMLTSGGSLFTHSLLSNVQNWSEQNTDSNLMKTSQAYKLSERHLRNRRVSQTPQLRVSLERPNYPFAIRQARPLWA